MKDYLILFMLITIWCDVSGQVDKRRMTDKQLHRNDGVFDTNYYKDYSQALESFEVNSISPFKIQIFPNPFLDNFFILNESVNRYKLNVFDISGELVLSSFVNEGMNKYDFHKMKPGVYTLKIRYKKMNAYSKILKS